MRRLAIAALTLMLVPPPAAATSPVPIHGEQDVHAGPATAQTRLPVVADVHIQGDAELATSPAVRSGSGTPEDPYVISDWIVGNAANPTALHLEDTRAHVVLERLWFPSLDRHHDLVATQAIRLENVTNVHVENVLVRQAGTAIDVDASTNVNVERVQIGGQATDRRILTDIGLHVHGSRSVDVGNLTVRTSWTEARIHASQDVAIHDATFETSGAGEIQIEETRDVHLRFVDNRGTGIEMGFSNNRNLSVERSIFDGSAEPRGLTVLAGAGANEGIAGADLVEGLEVCGTTFRNFTDSILLTAVRNASIEGNLFEDGADHVELHAVPGSGGSNISLGRNLLQNTSGQGVSLTGIPDGDDSSAVHINSFENTTEAGYLANVNASDNWWGHPSGPSGDFDGAGHPLYGFNQTIEPVLKEPPEAGPGAVDCGHHERPVGAKARPNLSFAASTTLAVDESVDEQLGPARIEAQLDEQIQLASGPHDVPAQLGPPLTRE